MTVVRNGHPTETYATRYQLKVIGFQVMDENEDGINEPGEYVHVTDIQIQNTGTSNYIGRGTTSERRANPFIL
jgi:hypothetical protein